MPYSVSPRLTLDDQRREEEREALDAHADGLGGGEVAELVQDDQRGEAGEGEEPAHQRSARRPARRPARARVAVGLEERLEGAHRPAGHRAAASPRSPSAMPVNASRPSRNACTATSLAALSMHGAVPPASAASRHRRRHGNASSSTGSKVSAPSSARSRRRSAARRARGGAARRRSRCACRAGRGARAARRRTVSTSAWTIDCGCTTTSMRS